MITTYFHDSLPRSRLDTIETGFTCNYSELNNFNNDCKENNNKQTTL